MSYELCMHEMLFQFSSTALGDWSMLKLVTSVTNSLWQHASIQNLGQSFCHILLLCQT